MLVHPVILAGGKGTRLQPLSNDFTPKPFIKMGGRYSMLQNSVLRLEDLYSICDQIGDPIIICNEKYATLAANEIRVINKSVRSVIAEPFGKNTAPALTLAAVSINNTDDIIISMHADQWIKTPKNLAADLHSAIQAAQTDKVVLLGVNPTKPNSQYGYIKKGSYDVNSGAYKVIDFIEKPSRERSVEMIKSDDYLWNSGNFVVKVSVWLDLIKKYSPNIYEACLASMEKSNSDGIFTNICPANFQHCESESIDVAVLQKMCIDRKNHIEIAVMQLTTEWSDLGEWNSLWEITPKDNDLNILDGEVLISNVTNSFIIAKNKKVTVKNAKNLLVVESENDILINGSMNNRTIVETDKIIERPWGYYQIIHSENDVQIKKLTIQPGESLSLQLHNFRSEQWMILSGVANVIIGNKKEFTLIKGQSASIPLKVKHRVKNNHENKLVILEIQLGTYFGEDDITRFEDKYSRPVE
jgi:mannose-1-phosphate guanylyltransferase/mannose-6-phosphate isomerase